MGDAGAIGVILHEIGEILSDYYFINENCKSRYYTGQCLLLLNDIVNIITKSGIDLDLDEGLDDIKFFRKEEIILEELKNRELNLESKPASTCKIKVKEKIKEYENLI